MVVSSRNTSGMTGLLPAVVNGNTSASQGFRFTVDLSRTDTRAKKATIISTIHKSTSSLFAAMDYSPIKMD